MRRCLIGVIFALVMAPAFAAEEDIVLRGMGSFHVGGRVVVPLRNVLTEVVLGHSRTLPSQWLCR